MKNVVNKKQDVGTRVRRVAGGNLRTKSDGPTVLYLTTSKWRPLYYKTTASIRR